MYNYHKKFNVIKKIYDYKYVYVNMYLWMCMKYIIIKYRVQ